MDFKLTLHADTVELAPLFILSLLSLLSPSLKNYMLSEYLKGKDLEEFYLKIFMRTSLKISVTTTAVLPLLFFLLLLLFTKKLTSKSRER